MKTLGFNDTPLITTVSLKLSRIVPYDLSNLLGGLSNVVDLKLFGVCTFPFQGIAYESSLEEIKFMFLKKLQLTVNLNCPQESEIVHCILRNTPSLNYLNIDMKILMVTDPPTDIFTWPEPDNISFKFRHLKIFNMDFGYGWKSEMRFIKFVLGSAPSLEESNIKCGWPSVLINVVGILRELSFKRASSAKVNFSL